MHVVYCLTSSGGDRYEAMTRVSLATVRLSNPSARIEIACDQQTHQALQASGSQLFREADAVHGFPTPQGPPTYRNRFVKTQLRMLLSGPFLFLDSDTVVRKPLTPLLDIQADIAAAPNHSRDTLPEQIWSEDQANLDAMGWQVRAPYVNGGVIWYADTPAARHFAQTWHQNWLANVERTGRFRDQPALNAALATCKPQIHILEHAWNAQVRGAPKEAASAHIWHLYLEWGSDVIFEFKRLLDQANSSRNASPAAIAERLLSKRHPWCSRSVVDDLIARQMIATNSMPAAARYWLGSSPLRFLSRALAGCYARLHHAS